MNSMHVVFSCGLAMMLAGQPAGERVPELLTAANQAARRGQMEQALRLATAAVEANPRSAAAALFRGRVHEFKQRHAEAIADFTRAIEIDPNLVEAYDRRGGERFRQGKVAESIADFDRTVALRPEFGPLHWRRGIAYYYVGRYADGKRQFEESGKKNPGDIENALWHFACAAREGGINKARAVMLPRGDDPRAPMARLYDLYAGRAYAADVLSAAEAGNRPAAEQRVSLFFAHFYVGLYKDAAGQEKEGAESIRQAAETYAIGGYMTDVARVHSQIRAKPRPGR